MKTMRAIALLFAACSPFALAQAPSNNDCTGAIAVGSLPFQASGDTSGATTDLDVSRCGISPVVRGVWYSFVGRGTVTAIDVTSTFVSEVAVFSGDCGFLRCVASSGFENGALASTLDYFTAEANEQYFILVTGNDQGGGDLSEKVGTFDISISEFPRLQKDQCSGAEQINNLPFVSSSTTVGAFHDFEVGRCGVSPSVRGVWYSFVGLGTVTAIDVQSSFVSEVAVFSGDCGFLRCVSSSGFENGALASTLTFLAEANSRYFILVTGNDQGGGFLPSKVGTFDISVTESERLQKDQCSGAEVINNLPFVSSSTTEGAFPDFDVPRCGISPSVRGVWYSFVGLGTVTAIDVQSPFVSEVAVFTGDCGFLRCVASSGFENGALASTLTFLGESNTQYFILVTGNDQGGGTLPLKAGAFDIQVTEFERLETDECTGSEQIGSLPFISSSTTVGAFPDVDVVRCGISPLARGVWYSLEGDGSKISVQVNSAFVGEVAVFSGDCIFTECVANSAFQNNALSISLEFDTLANTQYFILVTGNDQGGGGQFLKVGTFDISVSSA